MSSSNNSASLATGANSLTLLATLAETQARINQTQTQVGMIVFFIRHGRLILFGHRLGVRALLSPLSLLPYRLAIRNEPDVGCSCVTEIALRSVTLEVVVPVRAGEARESEDRDR